MLLKQSKVGMYSVRLLFAALLLPVLLFISSSVSASARGGAPQTWTVVAGMENSDFSIQGAFFAPSDISVHEGDTIHWVVQSHDIHTVTFLAKGQTLPPFNITDPAQVLPQGGSTYDGVSYFNSGTIGPEADPFASVGDASNYTGGPFNRFILPGGSFLPF